MQVSTIPIADKTVIVRKRLSEITRGTTTSMILSGGGCPPGMRKRLSEREAEWERG